MGTYGGHCSFLYKKVTPSNAAAPGPRGLPRVDQMTQQQEILAAWGGIPPTHRWLRYISFFMDSTWYSSNKGSMSCYFYIFRRKP